MPAPMSTAWSTHEHRDEREEAAEERDTVGYRRDGRDVAHADFALAPYELSGEDRDEHRHHRREAAAQHRAGDQVRDRPGSTCRTPRAPTSQPEGEHERACAPARITRNALRRRDLAPRARGDGERLPRLVPGESNERCARRELARAPRRIGASRSGAVSTTARRRHQRRRATPPGCAKRKRDDQQREHAGRDRRATARGSRASPSGQPMSRAFCSAGRPELVVTEIARPPNGSSSAASVRLAEPVGEVGRRPRRARIARCRRGRSRAPAG